MSKLFDSRTWMRFKAFLLKNIKEKDDVEIVRRILLLYGISSVGAFFLLLLSGIAFYQEAFFLSLLDFSTALILLSSLTLMRLKGFHIAYIYIGVTVMFALYTFLFISGGVAGTAFMWLYTFPLFSQFLLGSRHGIIASLCLFLCAILFLAVDISSPTINQYDIDFALRFIPSYLTVALFAFMYEKSRASSFDAWQQIQSSLEDLIDKRTKTLNLEITKRKKREEELQNSEKRLSLALKGAKCGSWEWDIKENHLCFGENYYLIAGYQPNEFPQTYEEWKKHIHPDDVSSVESALLAYSQGETELYSIEFRFKRKDGTWMWILSQGEVQEWSLDGAPNRLSGLHLDINDRKQAELEKLNLEKQLRQKHKMEAIGTMAGGIAHNFNNILSIIIGSLEMAQRKIHTPEKAETYLSNAQIAALRSRDLVKQIMVYSRKGLQTLAPTQLHLIIEETVALLYPTIPASIELTYKVAPEDKNIFCPVDASCIQEILLNLYSNAVDAMDTGGSIAISLDRVELLQENIPQEYDCLAGTYARLTVQDTGCGIPQEALDKIFDPFFTTKEVNEGTGMGLSTVQGIIDQLRGLIRVHSTPGKGTTFDLHFPITQEKHIQIAPKNTSMPTGAEKILLVDDEEMLLELASEMLRDAGYDVTCQSNSLQALEVIKQTPQTFDLIVTDQSMPELTGRELTKKVREINADIPIILCSGHSNSLSEEEAEQLDIQKFCHKPLEMSELLQSVRQVLDKSKNS